VFKQRVPTLDAMPSDTKVRDTTAILRGCGKLLVAGCGLQCTHTVRCSGPPRTPIKSSTPACMATHTKFGRTIAMGVRGL
jgi:hypothetical protein